jgi:steroid 5-alpha reductase family enzyme
MTYIYLLTLLILFTYATLLFSVALLRKDNSIIDIAYGPAFILVTLCFLFVTTLSAGTSPHFGILCTLVIIWGTRLAYSIYQKNKGKPEDFRYATWRKEWSEKGTLYFYLRSYLQIFLLQAFIISIVLIPVTETFVYSFTKITTLYIAGCILWCVGFLFEATGDAQLDRFIKSTDPNKGTIMKSGLWKYTRHPNYFGESLMWWSIALIAFSVTDSPFVFLSPLLITYLLLLVSGVPLLEKKWAGNTEWEEYKNKTSVFLPLPPKK